MTRMPAKLPPESAPIKAEMKLDQSMVPPGMLLMNAPAGGAYVAASYAAMYAPIQRRHAKERHVCATRVTRRRPLSGLGVGAAAEARGAHGIAHQHGDGERPHAPRHWRISARLFLHVFRLHITHQDRPFCREVFEWA